MPISWTSEAEAKLFLGVLAQLKNANLKIDYKELAEHMGPECSASAVKQRIQKLRRDAESLQSSGDGNTTAESGASPAGAQKRKGTGGAGRKTGAGKKAKTEEKTEEKMKVEAEIDDVKAKGVKDEED